MLASELQNRITQFNPWLIKPERAKKLIAGFLPKRYVEREMEQASVRSDRALLIVGPRQSGKSTLVWHQLKPFSPNILFLNMEDPLLRTMSAQAIDFVHHVREQYPFITTIFIDEIQHMDEAALFVKAVVDARLNLPIWVTGSSSFHLRSRTRESLAGRATRRRLLPFSLKELVSHASPLNPIEERHVCEQILSHQLVMGSFPAVYLATEREDKSMLLNDLVESLVLRDASDLFRIKRIDAFRRLLTLVAGQIGNLVNLSELASICNVDVGTIDSYIDILEESHVVRRTRPFAGGKRREITRAPKIFFIDNGIRNQLLNQLNNQLELRMDAGQLLENWVFTEIFKALPLQSSLQFWRSKAGAEVDFVVEHAGKLHAFEVKSSSLKQPKLTRSAWSFLEAYKPKSFAVVNMALEEELQVHGIKVQFMTPYQLPNWLSAIFD